MFSLKLEFLLYKTASGRIPFEEWFLGLKDLKARALIQAKLDRLEYYGIAAVNHKSLGSGIYELKIYIGPGYRVYFGTEDFVHAALLLGGDKRSQKRDIEKIKHYWQDQLRRGLK